VSGVSSERPPNQREKTSPSLAGGTAFVGDDLHSLAALTSLPPHGVSMLLSRPCGNLHLTASACNTPAQFVLFARPSHSRESGNPLRKPLEICYRHQLVLFARPSHSRESGNPLRKPLEICCRHQLVLFARPSHSRESGNPLCKPSEICCRHQLVLFARPSHSRESGNPLCKPLEICCRRTGFPLSRE